MQTQVNEMEFGVELTKFYEEEEYHLPSVVYEFTSKRPYPVLVRVVETIPEGIDPQHIAFHEDSDMDDWSLHKDTLVFETEIPGRAEYKTVYAVYQDSDIEVERLMTPPAKFSVEQASAVSRSHSDDAVFTRSSSSTEDEATGGRDRSTGAVAQPTAWEEGEPEIADPFGEFPVPDDAPDGPSRYGEQSNPHSRADDEPPLVDQLVAELRADAPSDESLEYLEERFGAAAQPQRSLEVRIDQLQSDVADLRSYTNAFEDFLGEHGSPEAVVDRFEDRLDAFDAELESWEARIDEQEQSVTAVRSEQEEMQSEIQTITKVLWQTMQEVDKLSSDVEHLDGQASDVDVDERLTAIEDDLAELTTVFDSLKAALQD